MSRVFCSTADFNWDPASTRQDRKPGFTSALGDWIWRPHGRWRRLSRLLLVPKPQVRIHKAVEVPPRPPAEDGDSDTAAEPAEQEELLDSGAAAEQSDWL